MKKITINYELQRTNNILIGERIKKQEHKQNYFIFFLVKLPKMILSLLL